MKVSGDIQAVKNYLANAARGDPAALEANQKATWTYMEDLALSMPEHTSEYRLLVNKKGREDIEKRKWFLIRDKASAVGSVHGAIMTNHASSGNMMQYDNEDN